MTRSRSSRANLTYSMYFLLPTLSSNSFLTTLCFFSPLSRSFRSFASYRIQYTRYVCRSISCIVPGRVGWLRRAYRPRMKKEVRRNSSRQSFFDHLKCAPCRWSILERKKKEIRLLFLIIAILLSLFSDSCMFFLQLMF